MFIVLTCLILGWLRSTPYRYQAMGSLSFIRRPLFSSPNPMVCTGLVLPEKSETFGHGVAEVYRRKKMSRFFAILRHQRGRHRCGGWPPCLASPARTHGLTLPILASPPGFRQVPTIISVLPAIPRVEPPASSEAFQVDA